jgi:hypothetical protein
MSSESSPKPEEKRQVGGELIIPVVAVIFTLYYFSTIIDSPWTAQVNAFLVGSILLFIIGIFAVFVVRELVAGRATLGATNLLKPYALLPKRAGFIALTLAYLFVIDLIGFTLSTFLFLFGSMVLLDKKKRVLLCGVLALFMAGIAYVTFIVFFEKRLPKGPIEQFLAGIF